MAWRSDRGGLLRSVDWPTVALYLALLTMGWVSVCGASYEPDLGTRFLDFGTRSGMQLVWIGSAMLLGALLLWVDDRIYDTFSYVFYLGFMFLLLLTPFFAHEIKGSLSWIKVGSFSVQPAEFAKFATALCLAKYISRPEFAMGKTRDFLAVCAVVLLPMALIVMQRETGCALVYLAFFLVLYREGMPGSILLAGLSAVAYFVVGVRYADVPLFGVAGSSVGTFAVGVLVFCLTSCMAKAYESQRLCFPLVKTLAGGLSLAAVSMLAAAFVLPLDITPVALFLVGALVAGLLVMAVAGRAVRYLCVALFAVGSMGFHYSCDWVMDDMLEPHQQMRIRVLLGMEDDPRGAGYNVIQAKIAIGSGGLRGKGFLNGTQTKLKYVPEQDTDFIFCTVGEEEGFAGCALVLLLFLAMFLRLVAVAERQPDTMGRVYGYSVASVIFFHVFINVGMVLGLTPVIGIPLPFFSYGGSSLWGFTLLLFIFLRMDAAHKRLRRQ